MSIEAEMHQSVKISGVLFQGFKNAGESLNLLLSETSPDELDFDVDEWYSIDELRQLIQRTRRYQNPDAILEQIGIEISKCWYDRGRGRLYFTSVVDFIRYQTSSQGFHSVITGQPARAGTFKLSELDEKGGLARIHSSTLLPRSLELGVLYGGLGIAGDCLFFDANFSTDRDHFDISFVTEANRTTISWNPGLACDGSEWRLRHQNNVLKKRERFWQSINATLNASFLNMREASNNSVFPHRVLPLCASCKRIRDDKGQWSQLEKYIKTYFKADVTHGLCPECAKVLYPEYPLE